MKEVPPTLPVPLLNREIKGLGWFLGPVLLNAIVFFGSIPWHLSPVSTSMRFWLLCNIPYYLMVLVIAIRRARRVTATDFLVLVAGIFLVFAIMQELMDLLYTYSRR